MTVTLKVSDVAADWLYKAIDKALCKVQMNPTQHSSELLLMLEELFMDINRVVDPAPKPVEKTAKKAASKKPAKFAKENLKLPPPKLCSEHPKYGAIRSPRIDCPHCWEAYTRLNPLRAAQARRKYEREHRSQSG